MLPLPGYNGRFGHWPRKSPERAKIENEFLYVARSRHDVDVYQRIGNSNNYLLVGLLAPNRVLRIEYGADGILQQHSTNTCDQRREFVYEDGRLVAIKLKSNLGKILETSMTYDTQGRLIKIVESLQNTPKIGEIPASETISLEWSESRIVKSQFEVANTVSTYAYDGGKLSGVETKTANSSETSVNYRYEAARTLVTDSRFKIPTVVHFDRCRMQRKTTGSIESQKLSLEVIPTDFANLEISRAIRIEQPNGAIAINSFATDDSHLLIKTSVNDSKGLTRLQSEFNYDSDGRLQSKAVTTIGGTVETQYQYASGKLVAAKGPYTDLSLQYDEAGNVLRQQDIGLSKSYSYAPNGLATMVKNELTGESVATSYTELCQIKSVTSPEGKLEYSYESDGRIKGLIRSGFGSSNSTVSYQDDKGYHTVSTATKSTSSNTYSSQPASDLIYTEQSDYYGNKLTTKFNDTVDFVHDVPFHSRIPNPASGSGDGGIAP
jgi:hypothetical protein